MSEFSGGFLRIEGGLERERGREEGKGEDIMIPAREGRVGMEGITRRGGGGGG